MRCCKCVGMLVVMGVVGCTRDVGVGQDEGFGTGGSDPTTDMGTSAADSPTGDGTTSDTDDGTTSTSGSTDEGSTTFPGIPDVPDWGSIPTTCDEAVDQENNFGCEFYASQMFRLGGNVGGYVVANIQESYTVTAWLDAHDGNDWVTIDVAEIPAGETHAFVPEEAPLLWPGVIEGATWRVRSDVPVVVTQLNGLATGIASNDGSLLLPVTSWDYAYEITGGIAVEMPGNNHTATVLASTDDTVVEIWTPAALLDGTGLPAGVQADTSFQVTLQDGEALTLVGDGSGSLIGMEIRSDEDHPVAVFAGDYAVYIPSGVCCADHLEEQLLGVHQMGTKYVASRFPPRLPDQPEDQWWDVYALEDDTTVTFAAPPGVTGLPGQVTLGAGELLRLEVGGTPEEPGDFVVEASAPVSVIGYMTGADNLPVPQDERNGDPAMAVMPAVEQFNQRFVVLVPSSWADDYLVLTRPQGVRVWVDEEEVADDIFAPVGAGWEVGRLHVDDGTHLIESEDDIGVIVVGFQPYDSYAYVGASGTGFINVEG